MTNNTAARYRAIIRRYEHGEITDEQMTLDILSVHTANPAKVPGRSPHRVNTARAMALITRYAEGYLSRQQAVEHLKRIFPEPEVWSPDGDYKTFGLSEVLASAEHLGLIRHGELRVSDEDDAQ